MSGDLQVFLVVLFVVVAGLAFLYYRRIRDRPSDAYAAPSVPDTVISVAADSPQCKVEDNRTSSAPPHPQSEPGHDRESGRRGHRDARARATLPFPADGSEETLSSDVAGASGDDLVGGQDVHESQTASADQPVDDGPGHGVPSAVHGLGDSPTCPPPAPPQTVGQLDGSEDDGGPKHGDSVPRTNEETGRTDTDHLPPSRESARAPGAHGADHRLKEQRPSGTTGFPETPVGAGVIVAAEPQDVTRDERGASPPEETGNEPSAAPGTTDHRARAKRTQTKPAHKYKGLVRNVPQPADARRQSGRPARKTTAKRERSLPIEVRIRFGRGGFCNVSLIAKRSAGLPEDLITVAHRGQVNLRTMQDEWYQDVVLDNLSHVLRRGTVWTHDGKDGRCTWSLSGRDLYVLADRPDISGYVSQPSVALGRDHVLLCSASLRSRVNDAVREMGGQPTTVLNESFGTPPGWLVFRNIIPNKPVSPTDEADIFNALRPQPEIEISLERGIRLTRANWLRGYPPLIRVYGDAEPVSEVRIDGRVADRLADGTYCAPGWDAVGSHSVWCGGKNKSYSIVPFKASSEPWDAYSFPVGHGRRQRLVICGPIVRAATRRPSGSETLSVPVSNPVLLGPQPGQLVTAVSASGLRDAPQIASPIFHPIWALPADPLHSNKKTTHILYVAGTEPADPAPCYGRASRERPSPDVVRWCHLILDANRKGMTTAPDTESVRTLWRSYTGLARQLWRAHR